MQRRILIPYFSNLRELTGGTSWDPLSDKEQGEDLRTKRILQLIHLYSCPKGVQLLGKQEGVVGSDRKQKSIRGIPASKRCLLARDDKLIARSSKTQEQKKGRERFQYLCYGT